MDTLKKEADSRYHAVLTRRDSCIKINENKLISIVKRKRIDMIAFKKRVGDFKKSNALGCFLSACAVFAAGAANGDAIDANWTGPDSGGTAEEPLDMYNAAYWSGGVLPSSSYNLVFPRNANLVLVNGNPKADSKKTMSGLKLAPGNFTFLGDYIFDSFWSPYDGYVPQAAGEKTVVVKRGNWQFGHFSIGNTENSTTFFTNETGNATFSAATGDFVVGAERGAYAELVIQKGSWALAKQLVTAAATGSTGIVEVAGGSVSIADSFYIGQYGVGELTINGGVVEVQNDKQTHPAYNTGTATINLNGGILKTQRISHNLGTAFVNFNGGTLQANKAHSKELLKNGMTISVLAKGGTIDNGGFDVKIPATIGGEGRLAFAGGGTTTLSCSGSLWTGGSAINAATKVVASTPDAKTAIIGNGLVIDGAGLDESGDYTVFEYSGGSLTDSDLAKISFVNCGHGTSAEKAGNAVVVHFVPISLTLNGNMTWSELTDGLTIASGAIVKITSTGSYTLNIDEDIDVKSLEFANANHSSLNVASGVTLTAENIGTISNIVYAGTIVVKGNETTIKLPFNNASTGIFVVESGRVGISKNSGKSNTGSLQTIRIKEGAVFDIGGKSGLNFSVVAEEGSRFINATSNLEGNTSQAVKLELEGDMEVSPARTFGLRGNQHCATVLDLGNHTLTVDPRNNDGIYSFILDNTTILGSGTILIERGLLWITQNASSGADCTVAVEKAGALKLDQNFSVKNFSNGGSIYGEAVLTVTGTLATGNTIPRLVLADGATVKATGIAQSVTVSLSVSGEVTIDATSLSLEELNTAEKVPVLSAPAANLGIEARNWPLTIENRDAYKLSVETADGVSTLYVRKKRGLAIVIR